MTEKEACDLFSLPYDTDIDILQLLTTLCDIGFDVEEALQYLNCGEDTADGEAEKRESMLVKRRKALLREIHCMENRLDQADFLLFKIRGERERREG
ncbi:MAG: hypothetical protein ACOYBV_05345 [Candidatus Avilachnospira sp.]|jgi:DNA-binding transcriptional MerR regulator